MSAGQTATETGEHSSSEELTLLLLSDSSLPVGGFVSSSGLESFTNHGYLAHCKTDLARSHALVTFTFSNAQSYANLCAAFFYHLHALVTHTLSSTSDQHLLNQPQTSVEEEEELKLDEQRLQRIAGIVHKLNQLFDSMCLSPVNRRNSYAQGAAFLLLYSKSFGPPPGTTTALERLKSRLIDSLKREIRRGNWSIHYPISFAFVTGLLQLSFGTSLGSPNDSSAEFQGTKLQHDDINKTQARMD
jgi:urease accessory protein